MASKVYNPNKTDNLGHITNNEVLRIVMVGKTGIGKSATGNTILGRKHFQSKLTPESVTTDCAKGTAEVDGQQVAVIDTPGLFDTRVGKEQTVKDLSQCMSYAAPGPHVFLVIISVSRYTEEEKETVKMIKKMFGQEADKYSMVLFTRGDELDDTTIEDFLKGSKALQALIDRCNGQYHVFNNKLKDRSQVTELLQKIRNLVQKNGGSHYTSKMFQAAERAVEEEKQRILRETEEQRRKEREKLVRELREKYEEEMREITEEIKAEAERERKQRKKEMEREKQKMNEERQRVMQMMNEQRQRETAEREREKMREREEFRKIQNEREERHKRELREEIEKLEAKQEKEARKTAEESNPLNPLEEAFEFISEAAKEVKNFFTSIFG